MDLDLARICTPRPSDRSSRRPYTENDFSKCIRVAQVALLARASSPLSPPSKQVIACSKRSEHVHLIMAPVTHSTPSLVRLICAFVPVRIHVASRQMPAENSTKNYASTFMHCEPRQLLRLSWESVRISPTNFLPLSKTQFQ